MFKVYQARYGGSYASGLAVIAALDLEQASALARQVCDSIVYELEDVVLLDGVQAKAGGVLVSHFYAE
jgi:hypothetical protein